MPFFSKKYYPVRKIIFFLGEGLLILSSILFVLVLFSSWKMFVVVPQEFILRAVLVTVIFQTCLYFYDLYDLRRPGTTAETIIRMMQAFGTGCILLAGVYFTIPALIISTTTFWGCYAIICVALFIWRTLYYLILEKKLFALAIVVVGTGETASKIVSEIAGNRESGFTISALVGTAPRV